MLETFISVLTTDLIWAMIITFAGGLMLGYTGWGGARLFLKLPAEFFKKFSLVALIVLGGIVAFF